MLTSCLEQLLSFPIMPIRHQQQNFFFSFKLCADNSETSNKDPLEFANITLPGTPMHTVVCFHSKNAILVQELFCAFTFSLLGFWFHNLSIKLMWSTCSPGWGFHSFLVFLFCHFTLFCGATCVWPIYSKFAVKADDWRIFAEAGILTFFSLL